MDVLSCMTGVTRFQEIPSSHAELSEISHSSPEIRGVRTDIVYDKEENEEKLLRPEFWEQFDYALMEVPGKAIGKWEVVDTIYAYSGMEFLRPGQGLSSGEHMENIYAANNVTKGEGVVDSKDVKEAVEDGVDLESGTSTRFVEGGILGDATARLLHGDMSRYEIYRLVKDTVRSVTGGYWIGPRMEPAIRILKRVKDPSP